MELLAWKYLRRPYLELQKTATKGWGSFAMVSVVFYLLLVIISRFPTIITSRPDDVPVALLILILE